MRIMLELIKAESTDAEQIYTAWGRYNDNFKLLSARVFQSVADAENYLGAILSNKHNFAFHVIDSSSQDIVGMIKVAVTGHKAMIGYVIHRSHWGRGFASEAVKRITRILEDDPKITRIWATCALENIGSVRVLEKCGYQQECILKNWIVYPAQGTAAVDNYSYIRLIAR
jgi:RimJ/RimL family protein N-acetyltransferase